MGIYYTDAMDVLRAAGLTVRENGTTNGWQSRARSSGGFPAAPVCVFWHHTASSTSPESDLSYMINGSPDEPVGNMLIDRDGACWPIAAGASNCAGKGGPMNFSRGSVPKDSGNTTGWQIEVANNGTGEPWPEAQINAFFAASNALNAHFGNQPTDITSHALGAGDGYTDRKIDPARAEAVQGPWQPRSVNGSGTWSLADMRDECSRRAGNPVPPPNPDPGPGPPLPNDWVQWVVDNQPVLRKGDSGIFVKRMQHLLAAAGFMDEANTSNYDGQFGGGTEGALNRFKQAAGGGADGTCDSWTWGALMHTIDGIPDIEKGASGPDVKRMQHLLAANGYMNEANTSNYDGQWGNGTDGAKAKFDNDHGLAPSPPTDCGAKSWESLLNGWVW
jgi:peptidoglycan hydrolase-like protein with peptidoglycan-binding domain